MDESLVAVREIERRIESAEKDNRHFKPQIDKPGGIPFTFPEYAKLMYDLQLVAFQADLTRVSTMVVGREGSTRVYSEIGIPDPHHPLTHHRNNPDWIEKITQINIFHLERLAYFLNLLSSTPHGGWTLLEHWLMVYGSVRM